MKKSGTIKNLYNENIRTNQGIEFDRIKTTNVNILLNRVQSNKKKDFKKKINFILILISVLGIVGTFSTIS